MPGLGTGEAHRRDTQVLDRHRHSAIEIRSPAVSSMSISRG